MRTALRFSGFAADADQALRGIGIRGFGTDQRCTGFLTDQGLGTHLFL